MAAEHRSASDGTRSESPRYEIEQTLGRGGMATVYLAHDRVLDRRVALKVLAEHLAADESFRARFLREARLAARIAHPNVVRVSDTGNDERGLSIVMEYDEQTTALDLRASACADRQDGNGDEDGDDGDGDGDD